MIEIIEECILMQEDDVLSIQELDLDEFDGEFHYQISGGGWTEGSCTNRPRLCM